MFWLKDGWEVRGIIELREGRMGFVGKLGEEEWIRLFEKYNCHPTNNFINLFSTLLIMLC